MRDAVPSAAQSEESPKKQRCEQTAFFESRLTQSPSQLDDVMSQGVPKVPSPDAGGSTQTPNRGSHVRFAQSASVVQNGRQKPPASGSLKLSHATCV